MGAARRRPSRCAHADQNKEGFVRVLWVSSDVQRSPRQSRRASAGSLSTPLRTYGAAVTGRAFRAISDVKFGPR